MNKLKDIQKWLIESCEKEILFISIRFKTPPKTKNMLCKRCKYIFRSLFRKELGRHWYKVYNKYFFLIGIKELGLYKNMHAHFILGLKKERDIESLIQTFKNISSLIKFDIWKSDYEKFIHKKSYGNDIMIKKVYSNGVYSYLTKEILIYNNRIKNDPFILDIDMFN